MSAVLLTTPATAQPLFSLDNAFWISVTVIFLVTIISAFIRRRQRDRCVKLFHDYHCTFLPSKADPVWGDLCVTSEGIEVFFDAVYTTRRGITKSSALVYAEELNEYVALTRPIVGLSEEELQDREHQLRRSINPNLLRRTGRWFRNAINTISDAISRSFAMVVGRVARTGSVGSALRNQQGDVTALGKSIVGIAGNAYEPLLERHIGGPVVIRTLHPSGGDPCEFPGHLIEYSARFIAIYSIAPQPIEEITLELDHPVEHAAFRVLRSERHLVIECTGVEPLVVSRVHCGDTITDLAVALLPGTRARIACPGDDARLELIITRQVDLVIPRSKGGVRFGSKRSRKPRLRWRGTSPPSESPEADEAPL
ncbi:MAG: hypothetical protein ACF8MJ_04830 [Phycisphaerales bacterium JB050]